MEKIKRVLALVLAIAMLATVLSACGQTQSGNTETSSAPAASAETPSKSAKSDALPTITLYPRDASLFSGLVTGSRADYFAKEGGFQMEVWAYSDEKTNAMLTSGDLPDIMYIGSGGIETLETLIDTGKIINYEDYKDKLPNFFAEPYDENVPALMDEVREKWSSGTNGLYVLPWMIGPSTALYEQTGNFERNVVKLKWDVYEAIGAPEITDMWQLLDVVEEMMAYQSTAEDGSKMYGTVLDNGFDTDYWGAMYLWFEWHGYDPYGYKYFTENSKVTGVVKSIFDDDSLYKEGAKWYNEIYRRGLMDPDSISTARGDQAPKLDNGLVMMPAGTLPGWPAKYYEVFVPGLTVQREFHNKALKQVDGCVVINAETEHLDECLAFVNMLADPYAWLNINYGPEGDIWESDGNTLKITDKFAAYLKENGNGNGFPMSDGTGWAVWNTEPAIAPGVPLKGYVNVDGEALCSNPYTWPDAQAITTASDNWEAWKKTMDADSLWDYVNKNNITVYAGDAFAGVQKPTPSDSQALTIATIKDVVVNGTWNCVYAKSEAEFDTLWDQMVKDAMDLGAADIISWMQENYKPVRDMATVVKN